MSEADFALWYELSGEACRGSSEVIGTAYDHLEAASARAVLLDPDAMDTYVRYGLVATGEAHSEYGSLSVRVCRRYPEQFRRSVRQLAPKDRRWFTAHILDPSTCRSQMAEEE
jgi:hypothetical protein